MEKARILDEITRTAAANGGVPLGAVRFEAETGIRRAEWFGIHWARWGDAVREAGCVPNKLKSALKVESLLGNYAEYVRELGRLPTYGDLRLKRRNYPEFPSADTFSKRFRTKAELARRLIEYCRPQQRFNCVVGHCENYLRPSLSVADEKASGEKVVTGYVYLLKHGSRREYKIGRTNNRLRREGEIGIELPEKITPIHVIETDDPAGIEAYWHHRFADKRLRNEWFALTAKEVQVFKRWRRIH